MEQNTSAPPEQIVFTATAPTPQNDPTEYARQKIREERERRLRRAERFAIANPKIRVETPEFLLDHVSVKRLQWMHEPGFVTGIDTFAQEELEKKAKRAARFQGAVLTPVDNPTTECVKITQAELVKKVEARREGIEGAVVRPEAIHLYGTDKLHTEDILNIFAAFGPEFVEWINDSSCNIVFYEAVTARRAVRGLGASLTVVNRMKKSDIGTENPSNNAMEGMELGLTINLSSIQEPVAPPAPVVQKPVDLFPLSMNLALDSLPTPEAKSNVIEQVVEHYEFVDEIQPNYHDIRSNPWRGVKGTHLIMRYATVNDVKTEHEKPSQKLYVKAFLEKKGIIPKNSNFRHQPYQKKNNQKFQKNKKNN